MAVKLLQIRSPEVEVIPGLHGPHRRRRNRILLLVRKRPRRRNLLLRSRLRLLLLSRRRLRLVVVGLLGVNRNIGSSVVGLIGKDAPSAKFVYFPNYFCNFLANNVHSLASLANRNLRRGTTNVFDFFLVGGGVRIRDLILGVFLRHSKGEKVWFMPMYIEDQFTYIITTRL